MQSLLPTRTCLGANTTAPQVGIGTLGLPADFARLGWLPALACMALFIGGGVYSGRCVRARVCVYVCVCAWGGGAFYGFRSRPTRANNHLPPATPTRLPLSL